MLRNPLPGPGETPGGAPESSSPLPELHFNGFPAPNGALSREEPLGSDPKVAALSGARYKSMSPARLPISRSPRLTIPSGFSPSALLESPVLLTNVKAEPSPTTGTFSMPSMVKGLASSSLSSPGEQPTSAFDEDHSGGFEFRPNIQSGLSALASLASAGSKQQEHDTWVQVQSQSIAHPLECSQLMKAEGNAFSSHELTLTVAGANPPVEAVAPKLNPPAEATYNNLREGVGSDNGLTVLQPDNKGSVLSVADKLSDDGYNWRKYGQKHVKGCEFPRSYYKCTHPNCQMKKQLERSHDGHITEVIYKGHHDHPKPQPGRRLAIGAILSTHGEEKSDGFSSLVNAEDKSLNARGQLSHRVDSNDNPELSLVSASDDDGDGGGRLNTIGDEGADGDDPESKRRKQDTNVIDALQSGKVNREPRVVVQTVSEVDILDDGYRWRKYGQKVVKGNPNPRSYYKCTNAGCPVRKHVERASHDPKAVITTYEGKHNHDVPVSRNNSHDTVAPQAEDGANTLNGRMAVALNGMLRTCDIGAVPRHYNQSDERDSISLDLGVGISPRQGSSNEKQQVAVSEHPQSLQLQIPVVDQHNSFSAQATPMPPFYGSSYHSLYGSRENEGDAFTFNTPINHAPNKYYGKAGNLKRVVLVKGDYYCTAVIYNLLLLKRMEVPECTKIMLNRLQKLEPEMATKIMGYLLLNLSERQMVECALGPDKQILAMINKAKEYLASSPKQVPPTTPLQAHLDHPYPMKYLPTSPTVSRPVSSPSFRVPAPAWDAHLASEQQQMVQTYGLNHSSFTDVFGDDFGLHDQTELFGSEDNLNPLNRMSPEFASNYLYQDPVLGGGLGQRTGLRSPNSLSEYPSRACNYFYKGYCRHGMNCRYFHGQTSPDSFSKIYAHSMNELANDDHLFAPGSLEKLEIEIRQLLKARKGMPVSIASLPMLYQEKYGRPLQADGYLTESQRHGKTGYSLTKLLARLKNSICLIDRPHGQHSVVLLEDVPKYMDYRNERSDYLHVAASSCQIYLTFPADSTFTEEDVMNYFNEFGPVRDVRIPRQEKRMFGFVSFLYPETVRLVLDKGPPHFICGSRVLAKPYKEKPKLIDRKYSEKIEHPIYQPSLFFEMDPESNSMPVPVPSFYNNSRFLTNQLAEEHELAMELESRRLLELQLAPKTPKLVVNQHPNFGQRTEESRLSKALPDDFSSPLVLSNAVPSDDKAQLNLYNHSNQDSDHIELPDSPFASPR
ncbi:hypothetical protein J5N97_015601 [Dioscorea zingiberensis]|uniref:Uncharacterized protein n=1 Tax=Dioscorea zingiberensis TaxID=325984 RepID=A0A9D5HEF3_9LILI|nr:hypothetical protein J5N97_015601 [Dioscorea zingiberensis]